MIVTSDSPLTLDSTEKFIKELQALTSCLNDSVEKLKVHIEALPGDSNIEDLLLNLGKKHADRTQELLSNVPHSSDGLLAAVNLVQTYLQVTEFMSNTFCRDIQKVIASGQEKKLLRPYLKARQDLDLKLAKILSALKELSSAPPVIGPEKNPKIIEILDKSEKILKELDKSQIQPIDKINKFIEYLEDAELILKSDGSVLTEDQIRQLIETWGNANKKLPSVVPSTEDERKSGVSQFLRTRYLLENIYELTAEILRLRDPLGFRTP